MRQIVQGAAELWSDKQIDTQRLQLYIYIWRPRELFKKHDLQVEMWGLLSMKFINDYSAQCFNHFNIQLVKHQKQSNDTCLCLLMYFDWEKLDMSRININCLIIWKKADIGEETACLNFAPLKIHFWKNYTILIWCFNVPFDVYQFNVMVKTKRGGGELSQGR